MKISRRVATLASGVVLAAGVCATPALAATTTAAHAGAGTVVAMTNPSDGFCNADESGDVKLGGDGHLYECSFVPGLGYYWQPY